MKVMDYIVGLLLVLLVVVLVTKEFSIDNGEIVLGDANIAGDINNDGKVNSIDYILIRKHILKNPALTGTSLNKADLNKDGKVNSGDYILVRKIILGMDIVIPIVSPNTKPTATASAKPTITPTATPNIEITLNKTSIILLTGNEETLMATITPATTNNEITWSSSDTSIATVDSNGKVTGIKNGTVTITAKLNNSKSATCSVIVTNKIVEVTGVYMNRSKLTLYIGVDDTITARVSPSYATDKAIIWSSSDTSIATVDQDGKITGHKTGNVTITATSNNGFSNSCAVEVKETSLSLYVNDRTVELNLGESHKVRAYSEPSGLTLTWTSSNSSVATVDSDGKVTAKSPGKTTITATNIVGKTVTSEVTVISKSTGITIDQNSVSVKRGQTVKVTATLTPSSSTDSIDWASGNIYYAKVETIDGVGYVTGLKAGTIKLYARSWANGYSIRDKAAVDLKIIPVSEVADENGESCNYISDCYYYDENSNIAKNQWYIENNLYYYLGEDGKPYKNRFFNYQSDMYHFGNGGVMNTSWFIVDNYYYHAEPDGKLNCNITKKIGSDQNEFEYTFDSNCRCVVGCYTNQ